MQKKKDLQTRSKNSTIAKTPHRNLFPTPGTRRENVDVDVPCTTPLHAFPPEMNACSSESATAPGNFTTGVEARHPRSVAFSYTATRFIVYHPKFETGKCGALSPELHETHHTTKKNRASHTRTSTRGEESFPHLGEDTLGRRLNATARNKMSGESKTEPHTREELQNFVRGKEI